MNAELNISQGEVANLESFLFETALGCRPAILGAMADRLEEIVHGNLGVAGVDRPNHWAPLSPAYAKQVGREVATLILTGALKDNIKKGGVEGESVTVSISDADVPYAVVHQTGSERMPKRPYFPIDDSGNVLPWTESQIIEAAAKAAEERLA